MSDTEKKNSNNSNRAKFTPILNDGSIVGGTLEFEKATPTFGEKCLVAGTGAVLFTGAGLLLADTFSTTVDGVQKVQRGANGEFAV